MKYMVDLEQAIADWRKQMLAAGIKTPVPLEELEIHLGDEIERQIKSGTNAQRAFEIAAGKIGQGRELKVEFKKTGEPMELKLVKLTGIACQVIAGLFSLMILPKLFHHATGSTPKLLGLAAVAAVLLSWRYGYRFLPVIRHQWIRVMIGGICCLAGGMWLRVYLIYFVPNSLAQAVGAEASLGWFMASFLWAWSAFAILGGIVYGLEKAVRKHNEQYV
jgi:hypothetical protein